MINQIQSFETKPNYVYLICAAFRPGSSTFMTRVEYEIFPPKDSSLNDLYEVSIIPFENLNYLVIGFPKNPKSYLKKSFEIANSLGMKLVLGKPISKNSTGASQFPLNYSTDSIFTLETKDNNKIPKDLDSHNKLLQEEAQKLQIYINNHS